MEAPMIDPQPLIAPLFLANSLNWLALGVLLVQCCFYLQNFPTDQRWIRVLVASIFVLELVQTATTTHQAWWYTVTNWNNPGALLTFPWSAMTVPIMAGIIAAIVQVFYAWRIFVLSSNWILCGMSILIVVLALLQSITSIVVSVMFQLNATPVELARLRHGFELWITSSFVCDVLIAGNMLFILYTVRSQSIWERASGLVGRLIGITIGTGAAIALCGALTLGLFATTVGASFQYLPAAYIWGKLYSNSVMVSLNSRKAPNTVGSTTTDYESYSMRFQTRDTYRENTFGAISEVGDYKTAGGLSRRSGVHQRDSTDAFATQGKQGPRSMEDGSQISGLSGDTRVPVI